MYTLFARNGAGSQAVEALLELVGAPYKLEFVLRNASGAVPKSFARINPMAEVPALILPGGAVMTESAAMMIYLADLHPQAGLSPPPQDPLRPQYLRWMLFLAATIYGDDLRLYYPTRYSDEPLHGPAIKSAAARAIAEHFAVYANALGEKPFMLGDHMSALDVYAAMLCSWMPDVPAFFAAHPNMKAMYDRVVAVPAVAKVWQRNEVPAY